MLFRGVTKKVCAADCLLLTMLIPGVLEPPERFPYLLFGVGFHIAKLLLQQIYKKSSGPHGRLLGINQKQKFALIESFSG